MDEATCDRMKELIEFDSTKTGVKGLVDSGIRKVPTIFKHAPENLPNPEDSPNTKLQIPAIDLNGIDNKNIRKQVMVENLPNLEDPPNTKLQIPVIDLNGIDDENIRKQVIGQVNEVAKSWGFFQVLNHGIPVGVLHNVMLGVKRFHELDADIKAKYYSRNLNDKIRYLSNHLLFTLPAADWRDTLLLVFDGPFKPEELPLVLRKEMMEFKRHADIVAETICELLSEALGLNPTYLKSINTIALNKLAGHYYPACPEPELTLGATKHGDTSLLTLVAQDEVGGLQVLHQNQWIPVAPVHGALLCNIGDDLQLVSNDRFISAKHRVLASREGPRLSVISFYGQGLGEKRQYEPIKEAPSDENPSIYRDTLVSDILN